MKEKFVSDLWQTGKVVFCVFWFIYALKHSEYSPFKIIFVQASPFDQDEFL